MKILVSACLLGENCKYNGGNNYNQRLANFLRGHEVIPVCPEVLGGLSTPRVSAEIVGDKVCNAEGRSVDAEFRKGAAAALEIAKDGRVDMAILQSRSPSCGVNRIYDGTFSGKTVPGEGVFASLLRESGIPALDVADLQRDILVTGGTTFVSRYVAEYFTRQGDRVTVLNRGTKKQSDGVTFLQGDRNNPGDLLSGRHFDAVLDVTAYNADDVRHLLDSGVTFDDYLLVSSSAVYPESGKQPFREEDPVGENVFWGKYGTDKIAAEKALLERVPNAYVVRPPYLYGVYNNVYREAFVFDCAMRNRKFFLPQEGEMRLQFFDVEDLCRVMEAILNRKPDCHVLNVGNDETVSVRDWVRLCYETAGNRPEFVSVGSEVPQRSYFSFYDYEYRLDVSRQKTMISTVKPLEQGLREAFAWYRYNADQVKRKPFMDYIDEHLL